MSFSQGQIPKKKHFLIINYAESKTLKDSYVNLKMQINKRVFAQYGISLVFLLNLVGITCPICPICPWLSMTNALDEQVRILSLSAVFGFF